MDEQRQGAILADCIERLQAGETVDRCVARYGAEAAAMTPLLSAAVRLQQVSSYRLTADQRRQAKATLRAAQLSENQRARNAQWPFRLALPGAMRGVALAGMLALTLCVAVSITAVAASQPGDAAYPARIIVERAPVLLKATAAAKATAELSIADRRLADVERYLAATGQLEDDAVAALLSGDQAAAERAMAAGPAAISEAERIAVAARVEAHARGLAAIAAAASETQTQARLREAAEHAAAIAARLRLRAAPGGQPGMPPAPIATPTPTTPAVSPTSTTQPTLMGPTATHGAGPGPHATALTPAASATPRAPAAPAKSTVAPRGTAAGPRSTATPPGRQGATNTPAPVATSGQMPTTMPGGNPTAAPGGPGEPGGNPTAAPGGPGEPGGNPTAAPGAPGEPGGNAAATPGSAEPPSAPGPDAPAAPPGTDGPGN